MQTDWTKTLTTNALSVEEGGQTSAGTSPAFRAAVFTSVLGATGQVQGDLWHCRANRKCNQSGSWRVTNGSVNNAEQTKVRVTNHRLRSSRNESLCTSTSDRCTQRCCPDTCSEGDKGYPDHPSPLQIPNSYCTDRETTSFTLLLRQLHCKR